MIDSKEAWQLLKVSRSTFYRVVLPDLKKKKLANKIGAQYRFDEVKLKKYFIGKNEFMVFEESQKYQKISELKEKAKKGNKSIQAEELRLKRMRQ